MPVLFWVTRRRTLTWLNLNVTKLTKTPTKMSHKLIQNDRFSICSSLLACSGQHFSFRRWTADTMQKHFHGDAKDSTLLWFHPAVQLPSKPDKPRIRVPWWHHASSTHLCISLVLAFHFTASEAVSDRRKLLLMGKKAVKTEEKNRWEDRKERQW